MTFIALRLIDLSDQTISRLLAIAWQESVFPHFSERRAWKGLPPICRFATCQQMNKFTPAQQKQLIAELSGAFQTRSQQAKWDPQIEPHCKWCGAYDDRSHRFSQCAVIQDLVNKYAALHDTIEAEGWAFADMPAVHTHPHEAFLRMLHWTHPEPCPDPAVMSLLNTLDQHHVLHIFTDGSCQFPQDATARFATFSVCVDLAQDDTQRCHAAQAFLANKTMPGTLKPLLVANLRGEQSIPRAELAAVVWVCEQFQHADLWIDSPCTIDLAIKCQAASDPRFLAQHDNWDLVHRLWKAVQGATQQFHKIKAHAEDDTSLSLLQLYRALRNKCANDTAIAACWSLNPCIATVSQELFQIKQQQGECLEQAFHFLLECHARRASLDNQEQQQPQQRQVTLNRRRQNIIAFQEYSLDEWWAFPDVMVNFVYGNAWGKAIGDSILAWLRKFRWPIRDGQHPQQELGIAWLELVTSWMLDSGIWLPVKRSGWDGVERLIPLATAADLQAFDVKFSELAHTMSKLFLQVETLCRLKPYTSLCCCPWSPGPR